MPENEPFSVAIGDGKLTENCIYASIAVSSSSTPVINLTKKQNVQNEWTCTTCGKTGRESYRYKIHCRIHSDDKPFCCKECNAKFKLKTHLMIHMRKHTGERPYMCNMCGANFSQSSHLRTHMSKHSDEKKHICEVCNKKFKFKNSLYEHKLGHFQDQQEHQCQKCGKAFLNKKRLNHHHIRVHHNENNAECERCLHIYKNKSYLDAHQAQFCGNEGCKKRWECKSSTQKKKIAKLESVVTDENGEVIKKSKGRPKGSLGKKKRRKKREVRARYSKGSKFIIIHNPSEPQVENLTSTVETIVDRNVINEKMTSDNARDISISTSHLEKPVSPSLVNVISSDKEVKCLRNRNVNILKHLKHIDAPLDFVQKNVSNHSVVSTHASTSNSVVPLPNISSSMLRTITNSSNSLQTTSNVQVKPVAGNSASMNCTYSKEVANILTHMQSINSKSDVSANPIANQVTQDKTSCPNYPQQIISRPGIDNSCQTMGNFVQLENSTMFEPDLAHQFSYHSLLGTANNTVIDPNFAYLDNVKDLFNFQNITNIYDPSFLEIQENAQNLSMSVQENIDNVPQNLTVIPQNDLTHQLSTMDNMPQNLVINHHNLLSMNHHSNVEVSQPNFVSTPHLPQELMQTQNLNTIEQNCSRSSSMNVMSASVNPNQHNATTIYGSNCLVPQNLSVATIASHNQNTNSHIMNEALSVPQRTKVNVPSNRFNTNSIVNYEYQHSYSNPENLSNQSTPFSNNNEISNSGLQSAHDLSMPHNLTTNLSELSASMTEEVLQPQNLSESCQPENLTMPQNLSANSNNARRTHCFNQPKNLSIHTPIQVEMVPRSLICDSIQNQRVPQTLTYNQTNLINSSGQMHSRHMEIGNMNTNIALNFSQQSYGPPSNVSNLQTFPNPMYSTRQNLTQHVSFDQNNLPENLSCHSKINHQLQHQNVPENLSLASQPQNLSHKATQQNYALSNQMNQNFVIPQPQNLSIHHNWSKYDGSMM